ncbi:hypothetical protein CMV_025708 [Castanea mollissima]|uniref:Uncharacterized protein n=1 Tax=Castanea mollissima TaxID=60419 RepID=A0A8J4QDY4_9ROSI|nr:hypothetical protein CMV_025708 [Castanea mollissima]
MTFLLTSDLSRKENGRKIVKSAKLIHGGPKCPHHFQKILGKMFECSSFTCLRIIYSWFSLKCQCFKDFQVPDQTRHGSFLNQPEH